MIRIFNGALVGLFAALATRGQRWPAKVGAVLITLYCVAMMGCASNMTMVFDRMLPGCLPTTGSVELIEQLAEARELWADVGVMPTVCVSEIVFAPRGTVGAECGSPQRNVEGCSLKPSMRIIVAEGRTPARQREIVAHELGHLLRPGSGAGNKHLKCLDVPGDDLMCPSGGSPVPTERDGAFVRGELDGTDEVVSSN